MTSDSLGGEWEESCRWWICALYPGRSFTWHKERLGALYPIYQGTIVVFHYRIYPLFPYSLPHGNPLIRNTAIEVYGHRQGHSPTVCILCVCIFTCRCIHHKDKGRQGAAQPSLVPEESSIRIGSDPGGRMWSCGARTNPGWIQGSTAGLRQPEEWLDSLSWVPQVSSSLPLRDSVVLSFSFEQASVFVTAFVSCGLSDCLCDSTDDKFQSTAELFWFSNDQTYEERRLLE